MATNFRLWKVFLWLSNTDPQIFQKARMSSKWNRIGLSIFVLITGIFALISSSYFVRTVFISYNEVAKAFETSPLGWIISTILGLIWMVFIMNLDRMIIASSSKRMAVSRIPLAIAIGLIVSIPFEVQLFSGRINKALFETNRIENQQYEQKYDNVVSNIQDEISELKTTIKNEKIEIANWKNIMEAEVVGRVKSGRTGIAGRGPAYEEAKENFELHKDFLKQAELQLLSLQQNFGVVKTEASVEFKKKKVDQTYDFASQYEQFGILIADKNNKRLKNLANGIVLLFVLIELIPAIMKLTSERDSYDQLMKARLYLDEQAINVLTNVYMEEISNRKAAILTKQDEKYQPGKSFPQIGDTIN